MNKERRIRKISERVTEAVREVIDGTVADIMADNDVWKEKFEWLEREVNQTVDDSREIAAGFRSEGFTAKLVETEAFLDAALHFQKMVQEAKKMR